jgi:hypothetical protein
MLLSSLAAVSFVVVILLYFMRPVSEAYCILYLAHTDNISPYRINIVFQVAKRPVLGAQLITRRFGHFAKHLSPKWPYVTLTVHMLPYQYLVEINAALQNLLGKATWPGVA